METLALAALTAALTLPGARAELVSVRASLPPGCVAEAFDAPRAFAASGDVALRARGHAERGAPCDGWAWARVRVLARVAVTARAIAEGAAVEDRDLAWLERDVVAGRAPVTALPSCATAARALTAGTALQDVDLRCGPRPGDPVTVLVRVGSVAVEQAGRSVPCTPPRACALLPSGRRVEGAFDGGRLVVEAP